MRSYVRLAFKIQDIRLSIPLHVYTEDIKLPLVFWLGKHSIMLEDNFP